MHYAINVADLTAYKDDFVLKMIIAPVTTRQAIETEKRRWDGMAIQFTCDEQRASAIVEIIRKKYKGYELRMYQSKSGKGGWKRL